MDQMRFDDSRGARLPEVLDFMQLLRAVVHGVERSSKGMAADLGVTGPHRLVPRVVGLFPASRPAMSRRCCMCIPAPSPGVLQRLVAQGIQYRDRPRYWHSWNVDRLYAAQAR